MLSENLELLKIQTLCFFIIAIHLKTVTKTTKIVKTSVPYNVSVLVLTNTFWTYCIVILVAGEPQKSEILFWIRIINYHIGQWKLHDDEK